VDFGFPRVYRRIRGLCDAALQLLNNC